MKAILVEKKYKYDKITLASGKVVSASSVIIRDGKVKSLYGSLHKSDDDMMMSTSFSANLQSDGTYSYSVENGNSSENVLTIILEFITFIGKDIV